MSGRLAIPGTYLTVGGQWMYLYRAVDKQGKTVESYLSRSRDITAAKAFFRTPPFQSCYNYLPYPLNHSLTVKSFLAKTSPTDLNVKSGWF